MTTIEVFGARVRQARILRRLTGTAVVTEMQWKGARQTRLEQAEVTALPIADVERLAGFLRFPLTFFLTRPVTQVTPNDLLFRAPKSTPRWEQEYLAQFAVAAGDFLEGLQARWQLPPPKLPVLPRNTDVVAAAAEARAALGMDPHSPVAHLIHQVERGGVPVIVRLPRSRSTGELDWTVAEDPREKHIAYSARVGEFGERPLIVLRALKSWERTRWSVAHEIGHIVLHADGVDSDDQEEQANRFASELLAPAKALADEVPAVPSLLNLLPIKSKWGISIGALLRHLREAALIDEHRYEMLSRQLYTRINPDTGRTWGRTEPGWDERTPERPRLLAKWVERCFGATNVTMLAPHNLIWPQDVMEDLLAGQRQAPTSMPLEPQREPDAAAREVVVDFGRFRSRRRA